jgi:very-short-patch-repair endonuclease
MAGLNALPRDAGATAECRICGKPFRCPPTYRRPDAEGKTRGLYCSRACMWTDDDYRKRRAVRHSPTRLERWLFDALDAEGIQYERFATVGRYVPDALLTDYAVIIEVDGVKWHRKRAGYDQQRDRDLAAAGYVVMHFTDLEIVSMKAASSLIGAAVADVRASTAAYRAPLLWRVRD